MKLLHLAALAHVVHQVIGIAFAAYESHAAPQNPPIVGSVRRFHYMVKFDAPNSGALASYRLLLDSVTPLAPTPHPHRCHLNCNHRFSGVRLSFSQGGNFKPLRYICRRLERRHSRASFFVIPSPLSAAPLQPSFSRLRARNPSSSENPSGAGPNNFAMNVWKNRN